MEMEDDISVEVLPSPGKKKTQTNQNNSLML